MVHLFNIIHFSLELRLYQTIGIKESINMAEDINTKITPTFFNQKWGLAISLTIPSLFWQRVVA